LQRETGKLQFVYASCLDRIIAISTSLLSTRTKFPLPIQSGLESGDHSSRCWGWTDQCQVERANHTMPMAEADNLSWRSGFGHRSDIIALCISAGAENSDIIQK